MIKFSYILMINKIKWIKVRMNRLDWLGDKVLTTYRIWNRRLRIIVRNSRNSSWIWLKDIVLITYKTWKPKVRKRSKGFKSNR